MHKSTPHPRIDNNFFKRPANNIIAFACAIVVAIGLPLLGLGSPATGNMAHAQETQEKRPYRIGKIFDFDLTNSIIPPGKIKIGTRTRDIIPAIQDPDFTKVDQVDYLHDTDMVMGIRRNGIERAYPLRILSRHEIVNDTIGGLNIAVTYCPLCETAVIFERDVEGETLIFGVSGLLFNSSVLMFDRQSESLWSQVSMQAISGPKVKQRLKWLPSDMMTWAAWKEKYPNSEVLSASGFRKEVYQFEMYKEYKAAEWLAFPVPEYRKELEKKSMILGITWGNEAKAYEIKALEKLQGQILNDTVGGREIRVTYDPESRSSLVIDLETDKEVPAMRSYWFAWQAFHPKTSLYQSD